MASSMIPDPWDSPKPGNPIPQNKGILSPEMRKLVTNQRTVDVSSIRSDLLRVERKRDAVDGQTTAVISQQSSVLENFNKNIIALRFDVNKLGRGLDGISQLIFQQNQLEIDRIRKEQEQLRLDAERANRSGRENAIEQRINNALLVPVQAITPKLGSLFDRIRSALALLFGGWLTNQLIELIGANQDGNISGVKEISDNIRNQVFRIIGGLVAAGAGFKILKSLIGSTARSLLNLFIARPVFAAAKGLGRALRIPGANRIPNALPNQGPKGLSGLSKIIAGIDVYLNAQNGELLDAGIALLALFGPGKVVKALAGVAYTADQIGEMFGFGLYGKDAKAPDKIRESLEGKENGNFISGVLDAFIGRFPNYFDKPEPEVKPTEEPSVTPQEQKPSKTEERRNNRRGTKTEPETQPSPAVKVEPQETITGQPVEPPKEQQQPPAPVAQPTETITGDPVVSPQETEQTPEAPEATSPGSPEPAMLQDSPKISPVATTPQRVGELPPARPEIALIRKSSPGQGPETRPAVSEGELNPIPKISSANPDNFHRLYSELIYNVVA